LATVFTTKKKRKKLCGAREQCSSYEFSDPTLFGFNPNWVEKWEKIVDVSPIIFFSIEKLLV